jgi:hypothetical protein
MPPMAAVADPMIKVMEMTRSTLTPTSMAMSRSWLVARMALPTRVNLIMTVRATMTMAVMR